MKVHGSPARQAAASLSVELSGFVSVYGLHQRGVDVVADLRAEGGSNFAGEAVVEAGPDAGILDLLHRRRERRKGPRDAGETCRRNGEGRVVPVERTENRGRRGTDSRVRR